MTNYSGPQVEFPFCLTPIYIYIYGGYYYGLLPSWAPYIVPTEPILLSVAIPVHSPLLSWVVSCPRAPKGKGSLTVVLYLKTILRVQYVSYHKLMFTHDCALPFKCHYVSICHTVKPV